MKRSDCYEVQGSRVIVSCTPFRVQSSELGAFHGFRCSGKKDVPVQGLECLVEEVIIIDDVEGEDSKDLLRDRFYFRQ